MAGTQDLSIQRPGSILRLVPLVSVLSLVILALATESLYERQADQLAYCNQVGIGASCLSQMQLQRGLVIVWGVGAAAIGALMAAEVYLVRRPRGLELPARALLGYALFLIAPGIGGFFVAEAASYGRLPYATGDAFFYTYEAGSLFLLALTFLDYRPRQDTVSRVAVGLSAAHGIIGTILAFVFAWAVANPPVIST